MKLQELQKLIKEETKKVLSESAYSVSGKTDKVSKTINEIGAEYQGIFEDFSIDLEDLNLSNVDITYRVESKGNKGVLAATIYGRKKSATPDDIETVKQIQNDLKTGSRPLMAQMTRVHIFDDTGPYVFKIDLRYSF
jgi:hypothetical protein